MTPNQTTNDSKQVIESLVSIQDQDSYEPRNKAPAKGTVDIDALRTPVWGEMSNGIFTAVSAAVPRLAPGAYDYFKGQTGYFLSTAKLTSDKLVIPDEQIGQRIMAEISEFWEVGDVFKNLGFLHKRGYILSGPAGCGKTCLIKIIVQETAKQDVVSLIATPDRVYHLVPILKMIRAVEADRRIMVIFEDIDSFDEMELLAYLDGEDSINNVINIATTNKFDELPERLMSRPRRFDRIIKVNPPNAALRSKFFKAKIPNVPQEEVVQLVEASDGFSYAALADLVASVYCLKKPVAEAVNSLKTMLSIHTF